MPNLYQSHKAGYTKLFITKLFVDELSSGHNEQAAHYL